MSNGGELNIYNKMGGGGKYITHTTTLKGGPKEEDNDEIARIRRLEEKIDKLQTELKKLKAKIK